MRKCTRCSKPATLHITELHEGEAHELHLCETCAHQYLNNPEAISSSGEASEPKSKQQEAAENLSAKLSEAVGDRELEELDHLECSNCGITFNEFRNRGRLGCPHDYVAFERELMPLLENIHGATQHCGKFPKRAPDSSQRQYRLIKLRNELRVAIESEQYEEAARLRDEIQTLETELQEKSSQES